MDNFAGKTTLVTGASRGIGKAIALEFAKRGSNIAFNYLRNHKAAANSKKETEALGVKCVALRAHLGDPDKIEEMFENISNENTTSHRQLIIHEVMGRNCGWLTAYTAKEYHDRLKKRDFLPELLIDQSRWDVDAIYIPEKDFDFELECERLKQLMDAKDSVNIFLSEGAGTNTIVNELRSSGEEISLDAFGHVALDELNSGQWFANKFTEKLEAEKTLVQKSGYFARSAAPNIQDLDLIKRSSKLAAEMALKGESGVVGLDENNQEQLKNSFFINHSFLRMKQEVLAPLS